MNKLLKTFGAFVIALGIFGMAKVNAAENATLTIKTDNTTLSKGSTFSVAISAGSEAGINGLTGRISYNTDVLEYVSKSFKVDESFMNMGTFPEIAVITNEADIKKAEICTMEFKIKEDTTATSTDITLTQSQETGKLLVSLMEGQDAEFDDKVLTINIKEDGSLPIDPILDRNLTRIQISKQPNKTSYKVGETFDPTGMKVIALYDDGTQKELTNYTYSPSGKLTINDNQITVKYSEGGITKTATVSISVTASGSSGSGSGTGSSTGSGTSEGTIPQTGIEDMKVYFIIVGIMLVTSFVGLRRYRGI